MLKKVYNNFEEIVGSSLFVVMLVVLVVQTLSRQGVVPSLVWTEELSKLLFIYAGYIGIVASIKDNSHVSIDVFYNKLPDKARKWVYAFNQLLIISALVIVFIISIPIMKNQVHIDMVTLKISKAYLFAALPVLTLLMIYRLIERMVKDWRNNRVTGVE